jgi:hypothetical protein
VLLKLLCVSAASGLGLVPVKMALCGGATLRFSSAQSGDEDRGVSPEGEEFGRGRKVQGATSGPDLGTNVGGGAGVGRARKPVAGRHFRDGKGATPGRGPVWGQSGETSAVGGPAQGLQPPDCASLMALPQDLCTGHFLCLALPPLGLVTQFQIQGLFAERPF